MHSIVVLGDVRSHQVQIEREAWKDLGDKFPPQSQLSVTIPGGAWMMANGIRQMARECKLWLVPEKVNDIIYALGECDSSFGELRQWKLEPHELAGSIQKKARLSGGHEQPLKKELRFPPIPEKLSNTLRIEPNPDRPSTGNGPPPGCFENAEQADGHIITCPDIVVFDDLNVFFADLTFERNLDGQSVVAIEEYRRTLDACKADTAGSEKQHQALLGTLFDRFQLAREASLTANKSILEPVIIGSVREKPGRIFQERINEDKSREGKQQKSKTAWLQLLDDHWLRRRVIFLLDAQDLRSDGLSISTGLSWERTAQDTISQIRHSNTYRQFLQFGHVVVRYGVTGALHIENGGNEDNRTYTLFFDPEHDDTTWDLADRDGTVLGDTSIYVAHLVKAMQQECRKHRGAPELVRLGATVRQGVSEAIKSSQLLSRTSYGDGDCASFCQALLPKDNTLPKDKRDTTLPKDRTEPYYFPKGVFCMTATAPADSGAQQWRVNSPTLANSQALSKKEVRVVSASIPPSLQRQWSILMQSAMVGDMEGIAERIVKHGATQVFNYNLNDNYARVRQALTQHLIDASYDMSDQLQTNGTYTNSKIKKNWLDLCDNAIKRLNESEAAPKNLEQQRNLNPTNQNEKDWSALMPTADEFESKRLWHHFNGPKADQIFERLLAFPPKAEDSRSLNEENLFLGFSRSLSPDPIITPMIRYGKADEPLFIVDRREVEGYRAIERLMRQHLLRVKANTNNRPLCIALFGPPGSGKSHAVKAINDSLNRKDLDIRVLPAYNLGQYTSVDDLEKAFSAIEEKITDPKAKTKGQRVVPIAFFDEFDSNYGKEELGWLKFFLAPMEDGAFKRHNVQNAILVFAGGTKQTFDEFSMANRPKTDEQWVEFSKAKGPDFASRLSGHLDIVGINTTGAEDELFMIRRSLLIRSMLSRLQNLKEGDEARIETRMTRALLKVPLFRNGGRSIRMLLELCLNQSGVVSASEIPPIHQLNMHVDGKAFLDLLHERRRT